MWDEETHPWFDLATVTITTLLSPDVMERTCYNIANQPESLGILDANSPEDYNSIGQILKVVYEFIQRVRLLKTRSLIPSGQSASYHIEIDTGDCENAGTNAKITIRITGTVNG